MTTLFNADTSDGLKITSDTSGEIAFQSAGVTKAGVNATGLTGDASQLTGLTSNNLTGAVPVSIGGTGITTGLTTSSNVQFNSIGVGVAASATAGEIRATNNVTAYYSDDRLKTRGSNIKNALSKVMSLNGFHYEANAVANALGYKSKPEVGVSAQEVQKVLPEVVVPAPIDDKYLTVHYDKLVPLLIESIKELKAEVDSLKEGK